MSILYEEQSISATTVSAVFGQRISHIGENFFLFFISNKPITHWRKLCYMFFHVHVIRKQTLEKIIFISYEDIVALLHLQFLDDGFQNLVELESSFLSPPTPLFFL